MSKPTWLAQLNPLERKQAERWVREVGELRFLAIARAATATNRARGRERENNQALIFYGTIYWLTHPDLDESAAALAATLALNDHGSLAEPASIIPRPTVRPMTNPALRRIIHDGIRAASKELLINARSEAARLGIATRLDLTVLHPDDSLRFQARKLADSLEAKMGRQFVGMSRMKETLERASARALPLDYVDRVRRLCLVLEALDGLVNADDIPIESITTLFDDMVDILKASTQ